MIVIVLGTHRSGTSAMAGLLHSNGILMGRDEDFFPPPLQENLKGFYENYRFRRVNDQILEDHGYLVKSFSPDIPDLFQVSHDIEKEMRELILEYNRDFSWWGWKDPRTCLTLSLWLGILESTGLINRIKIICMVRDPMTVAASMRQRGNKESERGQFVRLAQNYQMRILAVVGSVFPVTSEVFHLVSFDDIIEHPKESVAGVSRFLGREITDLSFLDPSLKHW